MKELYHQMEELDIKVPSFDERIISSNEDTL